MIPRLTDKKFSNSNKKIEFFLEKLFHDVFVLKAPVATAPAAPAVTLPAATLPGTDQLAGFAALLPSLKSLAALSTAQTPATHSAIDAIDGATASLLTKVSIIHIE